MILVDKNFPKRRVYAMPYHYADDSNSLYNRECRVMFILENHTVYRNSLCPCIFRSSIIPILHISCIESFNLREKQLYSFGRDISTGKCSYRIPFANLDPWNIYEGFHSSYISCENAYKFQ